MKRICLIIISFSIFFVACGGGNTNIENKNETKPIINSKSKVTENVKEETNPFGVGPIQEETTLGELNAELAKTGEEIFTQKCTACHKLDKRHVGPALGDVLSRRNTTWVMNMILDPEKMVKEDPVAKQLLAEYLSPMANQNLTKEDARAVIEYIRSQQ